MRFNRTQGSAPQGKSGPAERGAAGEQEPPALEQRLQTLVELERGSRDLLEQREAERRATEKAEAEQRLAEVEAALTEAQAHKREQAEVQHKLARMDEALAEAWAEVKRMTGEIAEAKRQTEAARKEIKPRSERLVAEAQQALAKVRAEAEQERELRAKLERQFVALEVSEREARETLERELSAAHANEAAEAELRIAELEELLGEADAEAARQREQRAEIEQRLEGLTALEADAREARERQLEEVERRRAEAERAATEAHEGMRRVRAERNSERERLLAIEQQLQALVAPSNSALPVPEYEQVDSESLTPEPPMPPREDPSGVEVDGEGEAEEPERETEASTLEPEEGTAEELGDISERETEPSMLEAREVMAEEPSEAPHDEERGRAGRRRRRGTRFRKQTGACAVCRSTQEWQSASALKASGWIVTGGAALCPDCKRLGWQLPEGEGLPFRRSSEKQISS
jgi:DNA repair exonuclease SbcCD ATPase subunit